MLDFEEGVDLIVKKGVKYDREAYLFLGESLEFAIKQLQKKKKRHPSGHITPHDLLEGFRKKVLQEFGPMGKTLLDYWGVRNTYDIGCMVYQLIDIGVLAQSNQDGMSAFEEGFSFEEAFEKPFLPEKNINN